MRNENIDIVPYDNSYHDGVLSCLKRNFAKLSGMEYSNLSDWFRNIADCNWYKGDESYKNGYVLVDSNNVVGYCGVLISSIFDGGKNYKYANVTTWGIDEEYRFHTFTVLTDLLDRVDIVSDFTPSPVVEKISVRLYGFQKIEDRAYKFIYSSSEMSENTFVSISDFKDETQIHNDCLKRYYLDHIAYKCKGMTIRNKDGLESYIMYYLPISSPDWVNIIYVSNIDEFSKNIRCVLKWIYELNGRNIICDSRFINQGCMDYTSYEVSDRCRLLYTKDTNISIPGMLYSELPLLGY